MGNITVGADPEVRLRMKKETAKQKIRIRNLKFLFGGLLKFLKSQS